MAPALPDADPLRAELLAACKAARDYVDADEGAGARALRRMLDAVIDRAEGRA